MLDDKDVVYGLGEANRGINKRGYRYVPPPALTETKCILWRYIALSDDPAKLLAFSGFCAVCAEDEGARDPSDPDHRRGCQDRAGVL